MNRVSLLWTNPLDPKQDATQLALLLGFCIAIMMLWKIVFRHILED